MAGDATSGNQDDDSGVLVEDVSGIIDSDQDGSGIPTIEPSTITIEPDASETEGKRRGRPKGSKNSAAGKQSYKEVQSDLTGLLYSIHLMGAALLNVPELRLDEDEAKQLAGAMARVQKEFGVAVISPKAAALINMGVVGATIYGPRIVAMVNDASKKKTPPEHRGHTVIDQKPQPIM
jgi:hypothetical protein